VGKRALTAPFFVTKAPRGLPSLSDKADAIAACARRGFRFIGIEREEEYFEIAVKRLRDAHSAPDMFIETARVPEPIQEAML